MQDVLYFRFSSFVFVFCNLLSVIESTEDTFEIGHGKNPMFFLSDCGSKFVTYIDCFMLNRCRKLLTILPLVFVLCLADQSVLVVLANMCTLYVNPMYILLGL